MVSTWEGRVLWPGWEVWQRLDDLDMPFVRHVAIAFDGKVKSRIVFDEIRASQSSIIEDLTSELKRLGAFRERYEPS